MDRVNSIAQMAFSALDRRGIAAWAHDHVTLGGAYTVTGRFGTALSAYMDEPMLALQRSSTRIVCLRAPVRSGKTLIADVWLLWIAANDPGPTMWALQNADMAKDHAKIRIWPNLRQCPPVASLLPQNRHDQNICEIHFSNGMPFFLQGPSERGFQGKGIRYLILDETWCWEPGRVAQALARTGDFDELGNSHTLIISQGGEEGDDEDAEWNKGHKREWEVPCLGCGGYFHPTAEFNLPSSTDLPHVHGLCFDDSEAMRDESGDWRVNKTVASLRGYVCGKCGHVHPSLHSARSAWHSRGRYTGSTDGERVSFHFEATITRSWPKLLEEWLHALNSVRRGVLDPLKIFVQKRRAIPWSETMLFSRPSATFEPTDIAWDQEHVRFFTIDCQSESVYWGMICAWSRKSEARRLWFGRMTSEAEILARQAHYQVKPAHVGIDCGYETKRVYAQCVRNGWIALRGDSRPEFSSREKLQDGRMSSTRRSWEWYSGDPETGTLHQGRRFAYVVRWSNPTIKDRLAQLIGRGLWITPKADAHDEHELEYKRQMASEYKRRKRNPVTGNVQMIWVCPSGNNHLFDCAAEQVVMATLKRILPDIEREEAA